MARGTIKRFNHIKGFGFITPNDGGHDVFVDLDAVEAAGLNTLSAGQKVQYEPEIHKDKTSAVSISLEQGPDQGEGPCTSDTSLAD